MTLLPPPTRPPRQTNHLGAIALALIAAALMIAPACEQHDAADTADADNTTDSADTAEAREPSLPFMPPEEIIAAHDLEKLGAYLHWNDADRWKDQYGNTLLHVAANVGDAATAEMLIDHGADVNARGRAEQTPLHMAIRANNLEVARVLVDNGADVNARAGVRGDMTPLKTAQGAGYPEMLRLLVEAGAEP